MDVEKTRSELAWMDVLDKFVRQCVSKSAYLKNWPSSLAEVGDVDQGCGDRLGTAMLQKTHKTYDSNHCKCRLPSLAQLTLLPIE